jgi:large subunit ribosomal protein L19e
MASEILKVGFNRVWIDPAEEKKVSSAITREDIRRLIDKGIVGKRDELGTSRVRARERAAKKKKGRLRGAGGKRGSQVSKKRDWINTIRPIRRMLKSMLGKGEISKEEYKDLYAKARGGFFRNKTHIKLHLGKGGAAGTKGSVKK